MSKDEVCEQADAVQTSRRQTLNITLLASEWKSSAGGLSTLNRELAIYLSQVQSVKVSLLVPEGACDDKDKREAKHFGISILDASKCVGLDSLVWLVIPPQHHKIDVIVGHGVKLGCQVQLIKRQAQFQNCKWVHMVHTASENLSKYKGYGNPTSRGEEKHRYEIALCKSADLVVPVGPRLAKAYLPYLQECKRDEDFFKLIPGLFEREFGDLQAKQKPKEEEDDFIVLLCGRADEEDFEVKGYDIAVQAFTDQQLKGKHYSLLFVGSPEDKQDEVRERLLKYGITDEQLRVREFVKSRERMRELFCEVDMVIMPSKSEGFGLVALEALSAGLPILVGENSGFARAIKNIPLGKFSIVGDSGDPARWAEAIKDVSDRHGVVLEESKILKEHYSKKYCWKKQCEELVDRLWKMVYGTSHAQAIVANDLVKQCPSVVPESVCQPAPKAMQQQPCNIEKEGAASSTGKGTPASQVIAADDLVEQCPSVAPESVCQPAPKAMQQQPCNIEKDGVTSGRGKGMNTNEDVKIQRLEQQLPSVSSEASHDSHSFHKSDTNDVEKVLATHENKHHIKEVGGKNTRKKVVVEENKSSLARFPNRVLGPFKRMRRRSRQAQEFLDTNEEARISKEEPGTKSPKPPPKPAANKDQHKILTIRKGKNIGKKVVVEEDKSSYVNLENTTDATTGQVQDDDQESQENHEGRTNERRDSKIPRKKEDMKNKITELEDRIEEKERVIKEKEFVIVKCYEKRESIERENFQLRQRLHEVEEEKERNPRRMRDLEITHSASKDQGLSLANEELEKERASVSRLQNEIEKEPEGNSLSRVLRSDLRRSQSELQDAQAVPNALEQQLSEKEVNFRALQANLGEEQQARKIPELERGLENERLLSQSNQEAVQTKEETVIEQMRRLEQERELKLTLEERVRGLQTEVDEERIKRVTTELELLEGRNILQQTLESLEQERETYEQRIHESERTLVDREQRLGELQSALSVAQEALAEDKRLELRDWIIRRDEVIIGKKVLGTGAYGKVYQGSFRFCQVAVKQIHDLILSPYNRSLFEREMSIASRCRHPNLLQFIGATNDDGSPLFVTELLDTDLRKVLSQRSLHHEEIVCLALDVAIALNYLHLNKPFPIIHRDISSSNVLLWRRDDRWRAKLSDYGAANFMRQCMTSNPGARIYAAPEALTSQQSPKVDVYSFGLLLCEMCIGELPDPERIQEQTGLVTKGVLRELVMRCVITAPAARPTMNDVITELTQ